ncbi:beta-1,4-galactosyltransferase 7-like [Amphiura filiformis]|uniref:beta-1,4-galactosyltransferase 7-like n=1 Tax=Amphiura filiformis TaxID=82378 RepID=UPI003B22028C
MSRKIRFLKSQVLDLEQKISDAKFAQKKDEVKERVKDSAEQGENKEGNGDEGEDNLSWGPHKLAIIVPYRERFEELMEFLPYMHKYLNMQSIRHQFIIVNQIDSHRFNRASLINIGFLHSKEDCDYIVLHDVDLLPKNTKISYTFPMVEEGPHHVSAPDLHPKYHYKTFVGGILMMKSDTFQKLNGLSNLFWGWGREDDELYLRMQELNLKISRPEGITTGYDTFYHIHDREKRKRDMTRYGNQHKESFKRDRLTGLDTVEYELRSSQKLSVDGATATILHVELDCNKDLTPWCDPPAPVKVMKQKQGAKKP